MYAAAPGAGTACGVHSCVGDDLPCAPPPVHPVSTQTLQSPDDPRLGGMSLLLAHLTHKIGQASCQLGIWCPNWAELTVTEL